MKFSQTIVNDIREIPMNYTRLSGFTNAESSRLSVAAETKEVDSYRVKTEKNPKKGAVYVHTEQAKALIESKRPYPAAATKKVSNSVVVANQEKIMAMLEKIGADLGINFDG